MFRCLAMPLGSMPRAVDQPDPLSFESAGISVDDDSPAPVEGPGSDWQSAREEARQQLVPKLAVEALDVSVLPGRAALDGGRLSPDGRDPPLNGLGTNSGPWSGRMCSGTPRVMNRSARVSITSVALSFPAALLARHSRVNSSTTLSIRNRRPPCVRSSTTSSAQTWFGRSGRSRAID